MNFIAYRMVGGFAKPRSTFLCRLRWAVTVAAYMAFAAAVHHQSGLEIALVGFLTIISAYIARLYDNSNEVTAGHWYHVLKMSLIGMGRLTVTLLPYALVSVPFGSDHLPRLALGLMGLLQGLCYYVGWTHLHNVDSGIYYRNHHEQWHIEAVQVVPSGPETLLDQCALVGDQWGELLTGFFCYNLPYLVLLVIN